VKYDIVESTALAAPATSLVGEGQGRLQVTIMTPGWGSSGYYSTDVVEAAGKDRVFPAGTHMYINHPSATEAYDRPERDIATLAAVLLEDGRWDGSKLVSEAVVFSNWRQPITEMAPYIGVSIRGSAEVEEGEAEGRRGRIITRLTEGSSVDFVTHAGRGGSVAVLESAWNAGHSGTTVVEASANDSSELLRGLIKDRYRIKGDDVYTYAWVRDHDPVLQRVTFELEGQTNGIFQQQYTTDAAGLPATLEGDAVEVVIQTSYVPVGPAGQSTTQESEEDTMPQIEEARLRQLEADATRATVLETQLAEARAQNEKATQELAEARRKTNAETASRIVTEAFSAVDVTAPKTVARLAASAPLTESGLVDEDALTQLAKESAAELAEARGDGKVTNLGASTVTESTADEDISEAELNRELAAISGRQIKEA
jgi:hypothetical protein